MKQKCQPMHMRRHASDNDGDQTHRLAAASSDSSVATLCFSAATSASSSASRALPICRYMSCDRENTQRRHRRLAALLLLLHRLLRSDAACRKSTAGSPYNSSPTGFQQQPKLLDAAAAVCGKLLSICVWDPADTGPASQLALPTCRGAGGT